MGWHPRPRLTQRTKASIALSSAISINLGEWPLQVTIAPWKIAPDHSGKLTKKLAWRGKIRQYEYGTGSDTSEWLPGWQRGYICSPWSGRIGLDSDDAQEFKALLARCGITPSPVKVLTGRPGGYQLHYDGRHLAYDDWPTQRSLYAPDGTQAADVKSHGFVPVPGSVHPNGTRYRMAPGSGGLGDELAWQPEWTQALIADQEGLGRHCGRAADYSRITGDGRNNALYSLKKQLFYEEMIDEDDPEMARRIFEANDRFPEPLKQREVEHTVLRRKGFKRHGHFNPEPMEYADDSEQPAADPEPEPKPIVAPTKDAPIGATIDLTCDDPKLACDDLERDPEIVRALIAASWDETGRAVGQGNDWDRAPGKCHAAYDYWLGRWAAGTDVRTVDLEAAHLRWLADPGLRIGRRRVAFLRTEGERIIWLDAADKPTMEFPGWNDDDQDPRQGENAWYKTRPAIKALITSGQATSKPLICWMLNRKEFRGEHPELGLAGCKGFKMKQVAKAVERMVEAGEVIVTKAAVIYWRNRTWNTIPAELAMAEFTDDDPEPPDSNPQVKAAWYRRQTRKLAAGGIDHRGSLTCDDKRPGAWPAVLMIPRTPRS